jgi:Type I restriction enzyme R protein N terminus (HSDR_N)
MSSSCTGKSSAESSPGGRPAACLFSRQILVVEAKKTERILTEDAVGQARAYAIWLTMPYYLVTNGEDIRLYLFRGAVQSDVLLMNFRRGELAQLWPALWQTLNRTAVIKYKEKLRKVLDDAHA